MLDIDLRHFPSKLHKARSVALLGNGGNLAVAQHMASDIFRHTGKFCFAPDSINTTALADAKDWKVPWMQYAKHADLVIGITCRKHAGISDALMSLRQEVVQGTTDTLLIAPEQHEVLDTLVIPAKTYHEFECNSLWTIYMMMEHIGVELPDLPHIK
tara:strand:- start:2539 stop:3009 length:471 start_codon:yes stop_codon:yes gene_type:complete